MPFSALCRPARPRSSSMVTRASARPLCGTEVSRRLGESAFECSRLDLPRPKQGSPSQGSAISLTKDWPSCSTRSRRPRPTHFESRSCSSRHRAHPPTSARSPSRFSARFASTLPSAAARRRGRRPVARLRRPAAVLAFAWRRLREAPAGLLLSHRLGLTAPAALLELEGTRLLEVTPLSLGAVHGLLQARIGLPLARPVLVGSTTLRAATRSTRWSWVARSSAMVQRRCPASRCRCLRGCVSSCMTGSSSCPRRRGKPSPWPRLSRSRRSHSSERPDTRRMRCSPPPRPTSSRSHGDLLRFTHPLLASAAYESVDAIARRELHRRLAGVVDDEEERPRHLALAVDTPDADVAAALERAAVHARARGASAAAAELGEQARRLTPPDALADIHRRTVGAALYCFDAGDPGRAIELLQEALAAAPPGSARAEVLAALSRLHRFGGDQPLAAELARQALAEAGPDDRVRAEAAQGLAATLFFSRRTSKRESSLPPLRPSSRRGRTTTSCRWNRSASRA